jgi:cytochrome c oxidase cbb3-type subunit 3
MRLRVLVFLLAVGAASPQDASRAAFQKVCGACHSLESAVSPRRSREQWQETINAMVARGAKGTAEDFATILNYLSSHYGAAPGRGRGGGGGAGPLDQQVVDEAAADRGRKIYAAECIHCHGTRARGTDRGADLIRSDVVLHDRYGNQIGPFLRQGHPTQTTPAANLTGAQMTDLSHFLHQEVYGTLRSALEIQDVLTGDPKAGAAYFNGDGKCGSCHSPTGDLAGIGKRLDPAAVQQRFLFPMAGGFGGRGRGGRGGENSHPVTVTVTPASGQSITGTLVHIDDFNVALRDSSGEYRSFTRTPALKVVTKDPYAGHIALLDRISDKNMQDVVAYLETLK